MCPVKPSPPGIVIKAHFQTNLSQNSSKVFLISAKDHQNRKAVHFFGLKSHRRRYSDVDDELDHLGWPPVVGWTTRGPGEGRGKNPPPSQTKKPNYRNMLVVPQSGSFFSFRFWIRWAFLFNDAATTIAATTTTAMTTVTTTTATTATKTKKINKRDVPEKIVRSSFFGCQLHQGMPDIGSLG